VVVGMDAELDESSVGDVTQCEDRIVSQSEALLPAGSQDKIRSGVDYLDEILRPLGMETSLVVIRRANSLALYFICMTLAALMSLRDQWRSQQLRDTVQKLFTFLSGATRTVRVKRLAWPLTDYQRSLDFFGSVSASGVFQRRLLEELVPPNLPAVHQLHVWEMPSGIKNVAANFCQ